jgi:hypothetical protein
MGTTSDPDRRRIYDRELPGSLVRTEIIAVRSARDSRRSSARRLSSYHMR